MKTYPDRTPSIQEIAKRVLKKLAAEEDIGVVCCSSELAPLIGDTLPKIHVGGTGNTVLVFLVVPPPEKEHDSSTGS